MKKALALVAGVVLTLSVVPVSAEDSSDQAQIHRAKRAPGPIASYLLDGADVASSPTSADTVSIEIHADGPESKVVATLEEMGARIEVARDGVYLAETARSDLGRLAVVEGVFHIGPQARAHPLGDTSEGVDTMETATWTSDGASGKGQRVAIIDVGFDGYQSAQTAGDLPSVTTKNYCGGGNFKTSQHGTGVAEIVHDVAPEAKLYLICIATSSDLDKAVDYAIDNGIDVINHSVGWWNTSRGDGSGHALSPEGIAGRAVDNGIVWIQASGNHADRHWKGKFSDSDDDWFHEFETGDEINFLTLFPGQSVVVYLKWDKWPTTSYNYDLYLTDITGQNTLESSADIQNGDDPPIEQLEYTNSSGSTMSVGVVIDAFNTSDKKGRPRLDLFILTDELEHRTKSSSLVEPAGHPDVLTVGATCWSDDDLASYSSRGPNIAGLAKPNVTAPTGVTTRAYGAANSSCSSGFTGTSSAAPHAAGIAALILDTKGSLSPKKVTERMEAHVVDLGADGFDNKHGAGRLNTFGLCMGQVPNIVGTDGKDNLVGTAKNDVIHAYSGADDAKGKAGSDLICGGPGPDELSGGKGADNLFGEGGGDHLVGGTGADLLDGGGGENTADYSSAGNAVTVNLLKELAKGGAGNDIVKSIQIVIGSDFADVLKGDSGANTLDGGKKGDQIEGRAGPDILLGKRGGDRLEGGSGGDLIKGGSGSDHLIGNGGNDTGVGGAGNDICETIENLSECEA